MTPQTLYIIVNTATGSVYTGGGSSTPAQARVFGTREQAERSLKRIRRHAGDVLEITTYERKNND